jgi:hypothetical protein
LRCGAGAVTSDDPLIAKALEKRAAVGRCALRAAHRHDRRADGARAEEWAPGDFLNKPFSVALRNILVARYESAGQQPSPASADEIHTEQTAGSFKFDISGIEAQKERIRIALGKNSGMFYRLRCTDLFGLVGW